MRTATPETLTGRPSTPGRPGRAVAAGAAACALLLLASACGTAATGSPGPEKTIEAPADLSGAAEQACHDGPRIVLRRSERVVPSCPEPRGGYPGAAGQPLD